MRDWIVEAVDEIMTWIGSAGNDTRTENEIIATIRLHSPFKDGVAYMPVPRCETCSEWRARPDDHYEAVEQTGECTSKLGPWSDCHDYTILTGNDFGCVNWKAKS